MSKLEVRRESQRLGHRYVSPGFEHHHSYRPPRKSVANYELGNDIEPNLLVCDGLNDTNRNDVEEGYALRFARSLNSFTIL